MRTKLSLRAAALGLLLVGLLLLLSSVATRAAGFGRTGQFEEAFQGSFQFGDDFQEFAAGFGRFAPNFSSDFEVRTFDFDNFTNV